MNTHLIRAAALTLACLSAWVPWAHAGPAAPASTGFIVELADSLPADASRKRIQSVLQQQPLPLQVRRSLSARWHVVDVPAGLDAAGTDALRQRLRADPRVRAVVPDLREQRMAVTPSDARFGSQWWLQPVAAGNTGVAGFASAWDRSTGTAPGVVVAVLDSGITSHIETNARVLPGWDFVADPVFSGDGNGRDNDPQDPGDAVTDADRAAQPDKFSGCPAAALSSWHGTTIAGQLAAVTNNGEGVAAANWQGLVLPVRVAGKCGAALSDIIDGLRWAAGLPVTGALANPTPARVIVLSYGGTDPCDANSSDAAVRDTARLYEATLAEVRARGALVVVAAGNQRTAVGRPASCTGAFAVTAVNREGYKAAYANFGAAIRLATPGGDDASGGDCAAGDANLRDGGVVSIGNLGAQTPGLAGYAAASGTSFAAPAVAATAALMLSVNPALTLAQIEQGLTATVRPHVAVPLLGDCATGSNPGRCACTTSTCGAGLLDADQALAWAAAPGSWTAPVRSAVTLSDDRLRACAAALGRPVDPVAPEPPASAPEVPASAPEVPASAPEVPASAPEAPAPAPGASASAPSGDAAAGGGGGGGAMHGLWLAGLALLACLLAGLKPQRP